MKTLPDFSIAAPPSVERCRLEMFRDEMAAEWDRFVQGHPHGTPFHLVPWKSTLEASFGYKSHCALVRRGERITAVLPLFFAQNFVIGKVLISSPFAVYGGILSDDAESAATLHAYASSLGETLAVDHIELRNVSPEQCMGEPNVSRYFTFSKDLMPGEEDLMASLPKKTRNMVRKALKQPFEVRSGVKELKHFEALYSKNMRRLGTPSFPSKYFGNLVRYFGDMVQIREVWLEGKPMAACLNFLFRDNIHIYYAAADVEYNSLGPNTWMYFDLLRWGGEQGYRTFDFGRCKKDTGVFEFKRHWTDSMSQLPYEVLLVQRKKLPNFSPTNPKFEAATKVWKKLPLPLTRSLGPHLIKLFP